MLVRFLLLKQYNIVKYKNLKVWLSISYGVIAVLLFFCVYQALANKIIFFECDLGRHLQNGRLVFSHPELLYENFYAYTHPQYPFVNHHWLYGVLSFWVQSLFGWIGISIFNMALLIGCLGISFFLAVKKSNFLWAAFWSVPVIFIMNERADIRPESFSYLFLLLYFYIFEKARQGQKKYLFWLVPLQLFWVNIHIYSFLGLVLMAIYQLDDFLTYLIQTPESNFKNTLKKYFLESRLLKVFGAAILVSFFNPNFIKGFFYPLTIFQNYNYDVVENKSIAFIQQISINYNVIIFKYLFYSGLVLLLGSTIYFRKVVIRFWLIYLFFGLLGYSALRNIALAGIINLPIMAYYSHQWERKFITKERENIYKICFATGLLILCVFSTWFLWSKSYYFWQGRVPEKGLGINNEGESAGKFIQQHGIKDRIFNNYDSGSYLDYYLAPEGKTFVDNRPEAFPADFFDTYRQMQSDEKVWQEQLNQQDFNYIIFTHTDRTPAAYVFLTNRLKDPDWKVVYLDYYYIILARNNEHNQQLIQETELSSDQIHNRIQSLYDQGSQNGKINVYILADLVGDVDLEQKLLRDYITNNKGTQYQKLELANIILQVSNGQQTREAEQLMLKAIDEGARVPVAYFQLGLLYMQMGSFERAKDAFQKVLELNPEHQDAQYYLSEIDKGLNQ